MLATRAGSTENNADDCVTFRFLQCRNILQLIIRVDALPHMAVAAYYVLSALGLIVAAQATCSLRTTQDTYAPADQKIGVRSACASGVAFPDV